MAIPKPLIALISQRSSQPVSPRVQTLAEELLKRYGSAVQAILFYGSCLRTDDDKEGLVDLYVLVRSYRAVYRNQIKAFLNKLLPPNVFYLERPHKRGVVRGKYAVLSLTDFQRGTTMRRFHSYLWGRFAQPAALLYVSSDRVAETVRAALAQAVITFITRVLPQLAPDFTARDLWLRGLLLSYRAELRAERPNDLVDLFDAAPDYYENLTRAGIAGVLFAVDTPTRTPPVHYHAHIPDRIRSWNRFAWYLRCLQGKFLSILRLL
ncbi:MAG: hypothetical protein JSV16_00845, partial [Candidatus Hydrogenedentota bacterium]